MRPVKTLPAVLAALLLAGCAASQDIAQYTGNEPGFSTVALKSEQVTGQTPVWVQNREQADELAKRVHALVYRKTIGPDTAVQVALLNNKGLQAAYAGLGISAAEVWQQTLLPNPGVRIELLGIGHPELGAYRSIEGMVVANIMALLTRNRRVDMADLRFQQAQLMAVLETLRVAGKARQAWINAVAAFETVYYLNQARIAADAASELAQKLGETGALGKAGQAREHAFYAELTGQRAKARMNALMAKEELTRVMGLWGSEVDYFVPDQLPGLPRRVQSKSGIESQALRQRADLLVAKLELEAMGKSYGLTGATRFVTDLELTGGFEAEREKEETGRKTTTTPQLELEFVIPIFDSGEARLRKAELAYMRAANLLAEKAVNVRSEARSAYMAYRASYDIARHYQNAVLPLRSKIEQEALLTYNGMITNTFELLTDIRAKIGTIVLSVNARRDFWLADASLSAAIDGGGAPAGAGGGETIAIADNGGGGH